MFEKQKIPKEKGKLKWICNEAYFLVPNTVRDNINSRILAFTLGVAAGYGVAWGGEYIASQNDLPLKQITSHSLATTLGIPTGAYIIAPKNTRDFIKENPTYSSGVLGVMLGASTKALEVLLL